MPQVDISAFASSIPSGKWCSTAAVSLHSAQVASCAGASDLRDEVELVEARLRVDGAVVPHELVLLGQLRSQGGASISTNTAEQASQLLPKGQQHTAAAKEAYPSVHHCVACRANNTRCTTRLDTAADIVPL